MLGRPPSQSTAKFFHLVWRVWNKCWLIEMMRRKWDLWILWGEVSGKRGGLKFLSGDLKERVPFSRSWHPLQSYSLSFAKPHLDIAMTYLVTKAFIRRPVWCLKRHVIKERCSRWGRTYHSSFSPDKAVVVVEGERVWARGHSGVGVELFQELRNEEFPKSFLLGKNVSLWRNVEIF